MLVTGSQPFPFITKEGSLGSFKTVGTSEFNGDFNYGDVITGSYPLVSNISSDYYLEGLLMDGERKRHLLSLKNTFDHYKYISPHYAFSSSYGNKELQAVRLISIPSIYYGQSIKKGTVSCKWFVTGTLIAEIADINQDGEMIQIAPSGSLGSGSVAGVVLYKEGFICLTGSWQLDPVHKDLYDIFDEDPSSPAWIHFMTTGAVGATEFVTSSYFDLNFEGTEVIPTLTMFARAEKGEFNHSNNPTYIEYGQKMNPFTGSTGFREKPDLAIKNIVDTVYDEEDPPFEKITYLSKVAIYDDDGNLIGVAKMANPVRKRENDNIAIKLKLDM